MDKMKILLCIINVIGGKTTGWKINGTQIIRNYQNKLLLGRGRCSSNSQNLDIAKIDYSKVLTLTINQGWIKSRLPVLFRTDSFRTKADLYRQFQKFLLVIDSFGPNICKKYMLKPFCILDQKNIEQAILGVNDICPKSVDFMFQ